MARWRWLCHSNAFPGFSFHQCLNVCKTGPRDGHSALTVHCCGRPAKRQKPNTFPMSNCWLWLAQLGAVHKSHYQRFNSQRVLCPSWALFWAQPQELFAQPDPPIPRKLDESLPVDASRLAASPRTSLQPRNSWQDPRSSQLFSVPKHEKVNVKEWSQNWQSSKS